MKIRLFIVIPLLLIAVLGCVQKRVDSALQHAEELKGTRKFDESLRTYQTIINRYPNNKKTGIAYQKIGDLYLYTFNKPDDAIAAYTQVIEKWPLEDAARESLLRLAEIYKTRGKPRDSITQYERIIKHFNRHEDTPKVRLFLAEQYLYLKDYYQASVELEGLFKTEKLSYDISVKGLYLLGESYFFLDKCDKAYTQFQKLTNEFQDNTYLLEAYLRSLECLVKLNRIDEAEELRKKIVAEYPDSELAKSTIEGLIRREEKTEKPEF